VYRTQIVGAAAKALVVGQPTVGNSTRQYASGLCRDTKGGSRGFLLLMGIALMLI